jgi:hypothetical protein
MMFPSYTGPITATDMNSPYVMGNQIHTCTNCGAVQTTSGGLGDYAVAGVVGMAGGIAGTGFYDAANAMRQHIAKRYPHS